VEFTRAFIPNYILG
jgi:hypothetical protein